MTGNVALRHLSGWVGLQAEEEAAVNTRRFSSRGGSRCGSDTRRLSSRGGSRCRRASLIISAVSRAFKSEHASWLLISQSEAQGWPQSQGKYSPLMRMEAGGRDKIFLIEEARRRDRVFQQRWNLLHLAVQNHCVNYSLCCTVRSSFSPSLMCAGSFDAD